MARSWPDFEPTATAATPAEVDAFARRFGVTLPDSYRRFLLESNGGGTVTARCNFGGPILNSMLSLGPPPELDMNDLVEWNERVRGDLKTEDVLIVGYDDSSGRVLLAVHGRYAGQVWHQVSDGRPAQSNPRVEWHDRRDVRKLADSFEGFMDSLGPL